MSEFSCSVCNYTSPLKTCVSTHIKNKNKNCFSNNPTIVVIKIDINCQHCNKQFCTKPSLKRHLNTCKVKKNNELNKNNEEIKSLKEQLASKPSTIINNNIIINLTSWRDPAYPDNMEDYYREAIKKVFMSVPNLIQNIHFNPDLPENQNICIKNYRTKVAKVYDGTKWITIDEDKLLNSLINTYEGELESWADDKPSRQKYIDEYKEIKKRDGRIKVEKDLKDTVKKLIYDNSSTIKTR